MVKRRFILLAAVSIDGKIAQHSEQLTDWTSLEDKAHMQAVFRQCDVILVGRQTYQVAYQPLSKRNCIVLTRSVKRVVQKTDNCLFYNPKYAAINDILDQYHYQTICLLGGRAVYDFALRQNLIDEIYLTIEPYVFGAGIDLLSKPLKKMQQFKLLSVKQLNAQGSILLHYIPLATN